MLKAIRKFSSACPRLALPLELSIEDAVSNEIEHAICQSLPVLAGLSLSMTDVDRLELFEGSVSASFVKFVALHGGPFGCVLSLSSTKEQERLTSPLRLVQATKCFTESPAL